MAQPLPLTEATLRQHATAESFSRGLDYERRGAVISLVLRGNTLQAQVEGSEYTPYHVAATFDERGGATATCTCPYDWGGWCKHIVAALLVAIHHHDDVERRPALPELLAPLDRDQLLALLTQLVGADPALYDSIDAHLATSQPAQPRAPAAAPKAPTRYAAVDPQPFRRQARAILHPTRYDDWRYSHSAVEQFGTLLKQVERFIAAGDAQAALGALAAITEEYAAHWFELDDSSGALGVFFDNLDRTWASALLSADLSAGERATWQRQLLVWQRSADEYGVDAAFALALAAAEQGWDYPPLQRAMRGGITEQGAWEGEAPHYADDLADIRLTILDRQGRYDEYLHLAEAESCTQAFVTMLARLGRVDEAAEQGLQLLDTAEEARALAVALLERGEKERAVTIAEHGLTLAEPRAQLADWLTALAEQLDRPELALHAAEAAFHSAPSLSSYRKVEALAGERWPQMRHTLLGWLRARGDIWLHGSAAVEILLPEGQLADAISLVEQAGGRHPALAQVVEAAVSEHSDWAITIGKGEAERIITGGKADRYSEAIPWLERVRHAYGASGQAPAWQRYLAALREQHGRKYRLMQVIDQMD